VSAVAPNPHVTDVALTGDILAHLEEQLVAARRLLGVVLEQGAAIRRRDIQNVVRLAGMLQVEMQRRHLLEEDRLHLLQRAGVRLAMPAHGVTLTMLARLMDDDTAIYARERTAELRGLLHEIQREHTVNRALMQQELAFLDHLLRLTGGAGGYDAAGDHRTNRAATAYGRKRMLDFEA
jgi:flagellar biosynthesis/type III secretory pathway chaperone